MKLKLKKNTSFKSSDCEVSIEELPKAQEDEEYDLNEGNSEEKAEERRFDLSEAEFNRELEQSYKKGYSDGMIKSIEQLEIEHKERIKQFEELNHGIEEEKRKLFTDLENQVVKVSIAIAEKILKNEISDNNEHLLRLIRKGFEKLKNSLKFTLYMNKKNKDYFDSLNLELAKLKSASVRYEIDDKLEGLDFYIESDQGNIYHIVSDIFEQIRDIDI